MAKLRGISLKHDYKKRRRTIPGLMSGYMPGSSQQERDKVLDYVQAHRKIQSYYETKECLQLVVEG